MPAVKQKRTPPKLDMNPMVDMAFLLVSFFMLTTTFKTEDPVTVNPPASRSELKLPKNDLISILVDEEGRIFFSVDGRTTRERLLNMMGSRYDIQFDEEQLRQFMLISGFGVPIHQLPGYLNMDPYQRQRFHQEGIPNDSIRTELRDWVVHARIANPKVRISVQGDQEAKYPVIKEVISMLVENKITRFNLITTIKKEV